MLLRPVSCKYRTTILGIVLYYRYKLRLLEHISVTTLVELSGDSLGGEQRFINKNKTCCEMHIKCQITNMLEKRLATVGWYLDGGAWRTLLSKDETFDVSYWCRVFIRARSILLSVYLRKRVRIRLLIRWLQWCQSTCKGICDALVNHFLVSLNFVLLVTISTDRKIMWSLFS